MDLNYVAVSIQLFRVVSGVEMGLDDIVSSCQRVLLGGWRNPRIIHKECARSRVFFIEKGKPPVIGKLFTIFFSLLLLFMLFKILELFILILSEKRDIDLVVIVSPAILFLMIYSWVAYLINFQIIRIANGKISVKESPIPSFRVKVVNRLDVGNVIYDRDKNRKKRRKKLYRMHKADERDNFVVSTHTKAGKEILAVTGFWTPDEVSKFANELREALQLETMDRKLVFVDES